jgi:conjugative transposon TraM protein
MQNTHSPKFLRKRKFMMVLPLLTLPFVTLAFWAMGGGEGNAQGNQASKQMGLNLQLPEPKLENEEGENKLSFYNKAQEDSIKLRQEMQNDPYYKNGLDTMKIPESILSGSIEPSFSNKLNQSPYHSSGTTNPSEAKIYERLNALNKAIQSPADTKSNKDFASDVRQESKNAEFASDVDRLENMMQMMNEKDSDDPEMKQLGNMLDKILDIQHPERVKNRVKEKSLEKKTQVFAVNNVENNTPVTYLGSHRKEQNVTTISQKHNGFFSTNSERMKGDEANAIAAVIHETQTVTTGSTVKLRLLTDIYVNGNLIPKGSFLFGTASLENERLLISIPGIRHGNNLLPVSLAVYDMDGLAGVYIPGSISRDVAKQSTDQSLQSIELMSLDPSLKAQAATAGIQAAKGLLSKKIKLVKVTVKAGYRVLLKDGNKQEN